MHASCWSRSRRHGQLREAGPAAARCPLTAGGRAVHEVAAARPLLDGGRLPLVQLAHALGRVRLDDLPRTGGIGVIGCIKGCMKTAHSLETSLQQLEQ
jgi:hypothetical protein